MFENANPVLLISSYELDRRARIQRARAVSWCIRSAARNLALLLRFLFTRTSRLTHRLAAKALQRSAVRTLHALDDRTLADLGILRSEIELAVCSGRPARVTRKLRQRQHGWSRPGSQRRAVANESRLEHIAANASPV
jgi:uncharacterized protein YjiS (DUF1127 family)